MKADHKFSFPKIPQKPIPKQESHKQEIQTKKQHESTNQQEIINKIEEYEQSLRSSEISDSVEIPLQKLNSTPGNKTPNLSFKKKLSNLEPFNFRETRGYNLQNKEGQSSFCKNKQFLNNIWIACLDEEIKDLDHLKNTKTTFEYIQKKRMSEESSLLSLDEFSESYKERKLESIKDTLMNLLKKGESPCKALARLRACLKKPSQHLGNVLSSKANRKFTIDKNSSPGSLKKHSFTFKMNRSERKKTKKGKSKCDSTKNKSLLGKRIEFDDFFNVKSETSSISSNNTFSVFDFEKKELPKHLQHVDKSMVNSQEEIKKQIRNIIECCNILNKLNSFEIYFMRKEDIRDFIFKQFEQEIPEKSEDVEVNIPINDESFNKPKIH
jgi:hypothetical protein